MSSVGSGSDTFRAGTADMSSVVCDGCDYIGLDPRGHSRTMPELSRGGVQDVELPHPAAGQVDG